MYPNATPKTFSKTATIGAAETYKEMTLIENPTGAGDEVFGIIEQLIVGATESASAATGITWTIYIGGVLVFTLAGTDIAGTKQTLINSSGPKLGVNTIGGGAVVLRGTLDQVPGAGKTVPLIASGVIMQSGVSPVIPIGTMSAPRMPHISDILPQALPVPTDLRSV